jgi:hypothetical protein
METGLPFLRRFRPLAAYLAVSSLVTPARAASSATKCHIQYSGPEEARWSSALDRLREEMVVHGWDDACVELSVQVEGRGARMTFVAPDGRTAHRELMDPTELLPTAQALSVPGPAADAPAPVEPVLSVTALPRPHPTTPAAPREGVAAPTLRPLFGARACVRSGADHLVSPCVHLTAALAVGAWELGLLSRYEIRYFNWSSSRAGSPDASALALGLSLGRRAPLGAVTGTAGVASLIAGLRDGQGNDDSDEVESRVAAYAGLSWPAHGRLALRADAMLEWAPFSQGHSRRNSAGNYSMPWWAVTSSLGVEIR